MSKHAHHGAPSPASTTVDPVCGMTVAADAPLRTVHAGETYRFCGRHCLTRFEANPAAFLAPAPPEANAPQAPAPAGAQWTCPMHPEIVRDAPGSCPICGMALEPPHDRPGRDGKPGADGHAPPPLGERGPDRPAARRRDGGPAARVVGPRAGHQPAADLDPAPARHAGGAVGRLAVLRRGWTRSSTAASTCSP